MGKCSFPQMNNNDNNSKKCLLINAVGLGHVLNMKLDFLLIHRSALTCFAWCIWAHLMSLEIRTIMPFVQKP